MIILTRKNGAINERGRTIFAFVQLISTDGKVIERHGQTLHFDFKTLRNDLIQNRDFLL